MNSAITRVPVDDGTDSSLKSRSSERPQVSSITIGTTANLRDSYSDAIALAQLSIDRRPNSSVEEEGQDSENDLEQLATALDLLGSFDRGPLSQTASLDKPLKIGRFEVLDELGRGGFGIVLRAFDPLLRREVALKIPRPERLIAGQSPDDFVHEAQTAARLEHPGIVRVYETRRLGPVWYIASAFCEGPTMAEWLYRSTCPIKPHIAVQLLTNIADAVHHAHTRGILHLDLKPENILLDTSEETDALPRPMITDFGLAGLSQEPTVETRMRVAGTLAYMAPEQRAGDSQRIGVTTDIYALGAILHDLIAGKPGLEKTSSGEIIADSGMPELPLRPPLSSTPRDLAAICQKCLRLNPDERYDSARELANDLRRYLRGEAVVARAGRWHETVFRWACRRPAVASLCSVLAVTVVVSVLVICHLWQRAESNLAKLRAEQATLAQTADRMRQSLLNLTWLSQENRLQGGRPNGDSGEQLRLLQSFYRDLQNWSASDGGGAILDAALRAANHSLALADGVIPLDNRQANDEFLAGMRAWQDVIRREPSKPQWRRALALHFLTYAARFHPPQWLWWRKPPKDMPTLGPAVTDLFEEPYAQLLVQYASRGGAMGADPVYACDMLQAALRLLQDRHEFSEPDAARLCTILTAYNQLANASGRRSDTRRLRQALADAHNLVLHAPAPKDCSPLLAVAIADAWKTRARNLDKSVDFSDVISSLDRAAVYYRRALDASPDSASIRIILADMYRRMGVDYVERDDNKVAIDKFRAGILVLDEGLTLVPRHREFTRRRAAITWHLGEALIAINDTVGAEKSLRSAVRDFRAINLRRQDPVSVWRQYVRCWQDLGQLYARQGRKDEAIQAYQESLKVLGPPKSQRGHSGQFAHYAEISRHALAQLSPQNSDGASQIDQ